MTKRCTKCLIEKQLSDFHKSNRATGARAPRKGYGVQAQCKRCRHQLDPAWQAKRSESAALYIQGMKRCNMCRKIKALNQFSIRRKSIDGRNHKCRECSAATCKKWKTDNPARMAAWFTANRAMRREYFRMWSATQGDRLRNRSREWAKANHARVIANTRHRELAKSRATPRWSDKRALLPFYQKAADMTRATGTRHEVDHIVPLRSRIVCGLHVAWNLQVITRELNKRKSNNHDATLSTVGSGGVNTDFWRIEDFSSFK